MSCHTKHISLWPETGCGCHCGHSMMSCVFVCVCLSEWLSECICVWVCVSVWLLYAEYGIVLHFDIYKVPVVVLTVQIRYQRARPQEKKYILRRVEEKRRLPAPRFERIICGHVAVFILFCCHSSVSSVNVVFSSRSVNTFSLSGSTDWRQRECDIFLTLIVRWLVYKLSTSL